MQVIRNIVVGTDFSESAERALDTAISLANLGGARITVVHVCTDDALLAECDLALDRTVVRRAACGVEVRRLLRSGKPWEKLHNAATEVGASLIVIGRGRAGNVVDRLVHASNRPVLVVPQGAL